MRLTNYLTETRMNVKEPGQVIEIIKKDCAPFLKELKQTRTTQFLYRGYMYASGVITKKKTRQDREPKDMDDTTSKYLDDCFKKKFGWYPRSAGIFATSNKDDASEYGKEFLFFPIGKYKYVWSPKINDLYTKIKEKLSLEDIEERFSENYYDLLYSSDLDGTWEYDGIDLQIDGSKDDAIAEMEENKEMFGVEPDEDINENLLKFVPDLTIEEFIDQKEDSIKEELRDLISSYTNKNLKQAIKSENEITFNCKEYYLVDPEKPRLEYILENEFI